MKSKLLLTCTILFFCSSFLCGQNQSSKVANSVETNNGCIRHPWQGKRVGYLGDSITDPNCYGDKIKKYWDFLQEWLGITPYVYGISGRQWNVSGFFRDCPSGRTDLPFHFIRHIRKGCLC